MLLKGFITRASDFCTQTVDTKKFLI
ncbi:hypothetical protein CUJ84_pRLN5000063 (plasmid) [Rhizobium leguminosarum]|uniref:Uncharacterized protein n=1 Tax=Rhizobium leguminosarum TaxID=384 RepID=A0A2K9ZIJ6_RHILE|nr:hypothetical protein CUJ84_pRLN5000063 [Rhizobium leguminosarum]